MSEGVLSEAAVQARVDWAMQTLGGDVSAPLATQDNGRSLIAVITTSKGDVILKAPHGGLTAEPAITAGLHRLAPDHVPGILAENRDLGCWLLETGGGAIRLPEFISGRGVPPLLAAHAALQRLTLTTGADWLAAGARDVAPEKWPGVLADVRAALDPDSVPAATLDGLGKAGPALERLVRQITDLRPPTTLVHLDLRARNVRLRESRARVIDWSGAGVGPAFLDPVPLFSEIATLGLPDAGYRAITDAALRPWTDMAPLDDLRAAQQICRVVFPLLFAHGLIREPAPDPKLVPFYLSTFLGRLAALGV